MAWNSFLSNTNPTMQIVSSPSSTPADWTTTPVGRATARTTTFPSRWLSPPFRGPTTPSRPKCSLGRLHRWLELKYRYSSLKFGYKKISNVEMNVTIIDFSAYMQYKKIERHRYLIEPFSFSSSVRWPCGTYASTTPCRAGSWWCATNTPLSGSVVLHQSKKGTFNCYILSQFYPRSICLHVNSKNWFEDILPRLKLFIQIQCNNQTNWFQSCVEPLFYTLYNHCNLIVPCINYSLKTSGYTGC